MKITFVKGRYMQLAATLTASLTIATNGMQTTWASPTLPKFTSKETPLERPITLEEESWIVSAFLFGFILGSPVSGFLLDLVGRKRSLLLAAVPMTVSWFLMAFVKSVQLIVFARIIAGIGSAITTTGVAIYLGEISEKDVRGMLISYMMVLKFCGTLYVYCVGPFVSYKTLTLSCAFFPLLFMVIFSFMPESPYYLIKIGKRELAIRNVVILSRRDVDKDFIVDRVREIHDSVEYDTKNKTSIIQFFSMKDYRKPLYIMFGLKTLQQFSGTNAIDPYLQTIVKTSESSISPELSSAICGFLQIPGVLTATFLIDKIGRKPLLIISSGACAISLLAEGIYFFLKMVYQANLTSIQWLPTLAMGLYLIASPMGVITLPYVYAGELFAINVKSLSNSIIMTYSGILGFLVAKFFGPVSIEWGMYTMFWVFMAFCLIGIFFVQFCVPETKDRTFIEIQQKMRLK